MTLQLVDTSVWIEYLRNTGSPADVEAGRLLKDPSSVATCGPVQMELLSGARTAANLQALEHFTAGLVQLDLDPAQDFHAAAAGYRAARAAGRGVRGLVDCLIAAVAWRHDVVLVHQDADLATAADVFEGLAQRDMRGPPGVQPVRGG